MKDNIIIENDNLEFLNNIRSKGVVYLYNYLKDELSILRNIDRNNPSDEEKITIDKFDLAFKVLQEFNKDPRVRVMINFIESKLEEPANTIIESKLEESEVNPKRLFRNLAVDSFKAFCKQVITNPEIPIKIIINPKQADSSTTEILDSEFSLKYYRDLIAIRENKMDKSVLKDLIESRTDLNPIVSKALSYAIDEIIKPEFKIKKLKNVIMINYHHKIESDDNNNSITAKHKHVQEHESKILEPIVKKARTEPITLDCPSISIKADKPSFVDKILDSIQPSSKPSRGKVNR